MRHLRSLVGLVIALLVVGQVSVLAGEARAAAAIPKVAIIVGPAGDATDHYRAAADDAARAARRYTPDVVEVVSPNATWPRVKAALDDASVVVYLGHGNGWPSRYRSTLYPPTQNGLGLNPVAEVDDVAHQYFGEAYLEREVKLAPNAVVVLSHLCYASGNSEPGLPEGTLDVARQRVDNFGAGWISAGASAVVAEAYLDPGWYVDSILAGHGTVADLWHESPTFHGHVRTFASDRRPGFVDMLDPVNAASGFSRSLVIRGQVSTSTVVESGRGTTIGADAGAGGPGTEPPPPTLASVGATVGAPAIDGIPVAGETRALTLPIALPESAPRSLVDGLELSARWDPLDVPLGASAATGSSPLVPATGGPDASPSPSPEAAPVQDPLALVVPETEGDVVAPVAAKLVKGGWRIDAPLPPTPGLYRLTLAVHGPDGVAADAPTQALVPRLLVRVVGPHSATFAVPGAMTVSTQETFALPFVVANNGSAPWAPPQSVSPRPGLPLESVGTIEVSAHWLPLAGSTGSGVDGSIEVRRTVRPGGRIEGAISLVAPKAPGAWLLVLDVATPESASLVAAGSTPTFVRVTVSTGPHDDSATPPRPSR
ncbi:MAG TPA: hypothetical protein VFI28_05255 [Candidatus Limnocylindrales bacterium]|nr:hypothetical protein [Candidatus Limnocylindrales bacterium]